MATNYLHFYYNGVHSSEYKIFYRNEGDSLTYPFSPSFSQEIATPLYQGVSYHLGTNTESMEYKLDLAAEYITNEEMRAIHSWLDIGTPHTISFDAFPEHQQRVVVTSISELAVQPVQWHSNNLIRNIPMFSVTFQSVGNPYPETGELSVNMLSLNAEARDPQTNLPILKVIEAKKVRVYNWTNIEQDFTIDITGTDFSLSLEYTDISSGVPTVKKELFYRTTDGTLKNVLYDSSLGIATVPDTAETGKRVLVDTISQTPVYSNGPLFIPGGLVYSGRNKIDPGAINKIPGLFDMRKTGNYYAILPKTTQFTQTEEYGRKRPTEDFFEAIDNGQIVKQGFFPKDAALNNPVVEPLSTSVTIPDRSWLIKGRINEYHIMKVQTVNLVLEGSDIKSATLRMKYKNIL